MSPVPDRFAAPLPTQPPANWRTAAISAGLHVAALAGLIAVHASIPHRVAVTRPPGTALGQTLLTYYSPGSSAPASARVPQPPKPSPVPAPASPTATYTHAADPRNATTAENGTGTSPESGLGEGDLRIALPIFNPSPKPNLNALAAGTAGDVVLDAVIDEHGRISQLTLLRGLDPSIDQSVIAVVQQWTFTPATRDGKPVASGQELHFHYERG